MVRCLPRAAGYLLLLSFLLVVASVGIPGSIFANPDYNQLVRRVMKGDDEQQEAWEFLSGCSDPRLFSAVKPWLGSDDPRARGNCAQLLAFLPQPEAAAALLKLLDDKDGTVRISAVRSLGKQKDPAMIAVLAGLLLDADNDLARTSAEELAEFGAAGVEPLLAALEQEGARVPGILEALRRTRDPRATAALRKYAASPDLAVAKTALRLLGHEDNVALEELLVRWLAADAKMRVFILKIIRGSADPRVAALLHTACLEADRSVRIEALSALRKGDPQADALLHAACRDADARIRAIALSRLRADDPQRSELLLAALADPDAIVRLDAISQTKKGTPDARVIDVLLKLLDDPDVCPAAAERLKDMRDPRLVEPLIARLARPGCPPGVITALASQGDPRAIPVLVSLLATPEAEGIGDDIVTREDILIMYQNEYPSAAERALRQIGQAAVPPLMDALANGTPVARKRVAWLLGNIDDPRCLPALVAALRDPEVDVRVAAINGLDHTGDVRAYEHFIPLLNDPNPVIRREAAGGLSECRDLRAFEPLTRLLKDRDEEVRIFAVLGLCDWEDPRVPALLLRTRREDTLEAIYGFVVAIPTLLRDPAWINILIDNLRYYNGDTTIGFLQKADPALAVPALLEALRSKYPVVRKGAAMTLPAFHEPRVIIALGNALTDRDAGVREAACDALAVLHDPAMLPAVKLAIAETRSPIDQAAYYSLLGDADPVGVEPLLALMAKAEGSNERQLILAALAKTGSPRATPAAMPAMDDPDAYNRREAIHVLGQCGGEGAGEALLQTLDDPDWDNRSEAAAALGTLKERNAVEPLLKLVATEPRNAAAVQALGEIGDPRACDALLAILQNTEMDDLNAYLLSETILALSKLHEQRAVDRMLALLQCITVDRGGEKSWEIIQSLTIALGELREERATELLAKLPFTDEVIVALGKIGTPRAAGVLMSHLQSGELYLDNRLLGETLGAIRDDRQRERVLPLLRSERWRVRWAGVYALGTSGQAWAIPPALAALSDLQPEVRAAAAEALGRLKAKGAGTALMKALNDPYPEVRAAAKAALAAIGE